MKKTKRSDRNLLKNNYFQSWKYLKESKNFIYIIMVLFFVFALIGFFIPAPNFIVEQILEFINELLEKTQYMSQWGLIQFIFLNNLQTSFFGIILGIFLGILPIIATVVNGYVLGFVTSLSVVSGGGSVLWKLLPHGIFELPAVFISLGLGLKLGSFIFQKKKFDLFKEYFWNSIKVFLFIIIPLLIIAAIIEGTLIFFVK